MGVGEDDGQTHAHDPIPLVKRTTKCVLCCKLCFSLEGKVFVRNKFHSGKALEDPDRMELDKRDVGRQGNGATVKCSVCAVHLCNVKGRFPGTTIPCFQLWHTVENLMLGITETMCHIRCPAVGRNDIAEKTPGKTSNLSGGSRGKSASTSMSVSRKSRK